MFVICFMCCFTCSSSSQEKVALFKDKYPYLYKGKVDLSFEERLSVLMLDVEEAKVCVCV